MQQVVQTARQVADSDIPVLIMGESGTGKELIARAIHNNSRRRKQRLVALNCAGLSESILEDELFGHVRGAFTGANTEREGRFEHADGGTLFMDEIGDMPAAMQAKLLRVLENGEVVRVGSNEPIKVDVRLISATNRKLEEMVAEKQFREDLYFRIKGVTILLPPLRERREDIPLLIHYFLQQAAEKYQQADRRDRARRPADADELRLARQRAAAEERDRHDGRAGHRPDADRRQTCPPDIRPGGRRAGRRA